jgi:hypothetical protein
MLDSHGIRRYRFAKGGVCGRPTSPTGNVAQRLTYCGHGATPQIDATVMRNCKTLCCNELQIAVSATVVVRFLLLLLG